MDASTGAVVSTYYYDAWGNQKDFNEVNGDFETDSDANGKDDNWSFANIAITSLSATTVKFGKKSQKIGTTTIASDAAVYKNYTTQAGHKYLLTGYCYVVSKADKLSTRANNQGNYWSTNLGNTYWPDTLNQWYQTGVVFTATSNATTIIPCFINKQLCEVYLDGWKLIDLTEMYGAGNEPTTLADAIKTVNNSITYAGYQYDKETGLYYLNARFYDAVTARFMQEDTYTGSIDDPLSLNLYSYVNNNPISYYDPTGHFLSEIVGAAKNAKNVATGAVKGAYNAGKRVVGTTIEGAKAIYRNPSVIIESADTIINHPEEAAQMVNEELVKPVVTKDLGIKKGSKPYKVLKYVGVRAEATAITGVNLGKGIVKGVALAGETVATDMAFSAVEVGRVLGVAGLDNDLTYENAHNEMYGKVNALANQWMAVPGAILGDIKTAGNLNNLGNFIFNPDLSLHEAVEYEQSAVNTALIAIPLAKFANAGLKAGVAGIRNSATALVDRSGLQPSTVGGYGTNISGWSGLRSAIGDSVDSLANGLGSNVLYSTGNATSIRNSQGIVTGGNNLSDVSRMMRGTDGNIGVIPKEIADNLRGRTFNNFDEFRNAFWQEVANSEYASEFNSSNISRMMNGNAPIAPKSQHYGKIKSYVLHHKQPIHAGGGVYNLDNLVISSPKMHQSILDSSYHFGH